MASIRIKNIQLLMTEIYKTRSGLSLPFMKDIFAEWNIGYNLKHGSDSPGSWLEMEGWGVLLLILPTEGRSFGCGFS